MSYNYIVQPGDILFYESHSWADKIISWFTKSPYVHCAIAVNATQCIAATTDGVKIMPINEYSAVWSYKAHAIENDEAQRIRGMVWLNRQLGSEYSWKDILSQLTNKLANGFFVYSHQEYTCSELCTRFLAETGDVDLQGLEAYPNEVTPGQLFIKIFSLPVKRGAV